MSSIDTITVGTVPYEIEAQYLAQTIWNKIYPVGSIIENTNQNYNPNTEFTWMTWEKIEGRFLIGADSTYSIGTTGGSANATLVSHNHTFTGNALSSHTHTFTGSQVNTGNNSVGHTHTYTDYYASSSTESTTLTINQIPAHSHSNYIGYADWGSGRPQAMGVYNIAGDTWWSSDFSGSSGGGQGHTHGMSNTSTTRTSNGISANHTHAVTAAGTNASVSSGTPSGTISTNGSSATGANMPPYLAVYIWKRTA